jgi:AsmA protein
MSATFRIADGVAATDNVRLLNPFVRLEGQGLIDIGAQSLDMRIAPRAVRSIEGQGGNAALSGLGIPFRVSGPWSRVSFRPALGDVVQNELRSRIGGILSQQDQSNPLTQLGASLFGQQPAAQTPAPAAGGPQPAQDNTQTPAPQTPQQQQQPENPLSSILGNVLQGRDKQKQPPPPAPAPAPPP